MTNREVLERANPKEIEQLLGYLLMDYWEQLKDKLNIKGYDLSPINTVTVYKNFLKQETYVDTDLYIDSDIDINLYNMMYSDKNEDIIDVEFKEIEEEN